MSEQPEDAPPPAVAVAYDPQVTLPADFLAQLREEVREVVLTDIHQVDAEHAAARIEEEKAKVKTLVKADAIAIPFAIALFVIFQFMDRVVLAEVAALVPNGIMLLIRLAKKTPLI